MTVLMWEKPKQVLSKADWAANQADSAPPGTFVPNMSEEDRMRWKAKLVGIKTGFPQVEIRRDSTVIIVSLRGYKYKNYDTRQTPRRSRKQRRAGGVPNLTLPKVGQQCISPLRDPCS